MSIKSNWICEQCGNELGWLVINCVYCDVYGHRDYVFNPDIVNRMRSEATMTPQEELYAELFNHEKLLVKDMDDLTLRAHREKLQKIAFEAKARYNAADDEEKHRKPKKDSKGFQRSVNGDDITSDAINTVKDRQKRLTKQEKIIEGLMKLPGFDRKMAEGIANSGALKKQLDSMDKPERVTEKRATETEKAKICTHKYPDNNTGENEGKINICIKCGYERIILNNPFAKK